MRTSAQRNAGAPTFRPGVVPVHTATLLPQDRAAPATDDTQNVGIPRAAVAQQRPQQQEDEARDVASPSARADHSVEMLSRPTDSNSLVLHRERSHRLTCPPWSSQPRLRARGAPA